MSKICASCGAQVEDANKFCATCGSNSFIKLCPSCGEKLIPGTRFCANCGYDTTADNAAAETAPVAPAPAPVQPVVTPVQQAPRPVVTPVQQYVPPVQQYAQPTAVAAPKAKNKAGMIIAIIVIVLVLIGGTVGGLYVAGVLDKDDTSASDSKDKKKDKDSSIDDSDKESSETDSSEEDSSEPDSSEPDSSEPDINVSKDIDRYNIFSESKYGHGYQPAFAAMMYGLQTKNFDKFVSAYPECVGAFEETVYTTPEARQSFMDKLYTQYQSQLGDDFTFKFTSDSETALTANEITELQNYVANTYKGNITISEGYMVTFKGTGTGSKSSAPLNISMRCIKVDGEWYVIE